MKTAVGIAFGFAAGVAALTGLLVSTGRLKLTETPPPAAAAVPAAPADNRTKLATPAPPDASFPAAPDPSLPAPPNLALTAPPAETHAMQMNGELKRASGGPAGLGLPLPNLRREQIQNTFDDARGAGGKHEATDILAPRGTPVSAVVEGNVVKLFESKKGGTTVYQFDNARKYCYYYAHLDHYATGLKEGMLLRKGEVLGYVGSTGDSQQSTPHLHFAILELGPDRHWYEHTTAINPYPLLLHALSLP